MDDKYFEISDDESDEPEEPIEDEKYFDISDESDEPEEPEQSRKEKPKDILISLFKDDYDGLKRGYKRLQRELASGKYQMDTPLWYRDKKYNRLLHKEPVTPADIIKEYERQTEEKSEGLLEFD